MSELPRLMLKPLNAHEQMFVKNSEIIAFCPRSLEPLELFRYFFVAEIWHFLIFVFFTVSGFLMINF